MLNKEKVIRVDITDYNKLKRESRKQHRTLKATFTLMVEKYLGTNEDKTEDDFLS